ncbi:hypothetical protein GCM10010339_85820 [Streptomyces alanosinicus]|uniref:Uncharacterized protein n=1 Tax=Streptomyces alanosinicus TaxID=68171 RepID=A0A918YSJ1_9ACTN|nr:hypothetical protein GCM10010339_85820 [Streptomyces alanosinicus]
MAIAAGAWSRCGGEGASSPADAFLAADAGTLAALGGQDLGVAGVGVAPAEVAVQFADLDRVVRVVRVGERELPQWSSPAATFSGRYMERPCYLRRVGSRSGGCDLTEPIHIF